MNKDEFNLRTEDGRIKFVEAIEKDLLPIMPMDFWFGKGDHRKGEKLGTVFTTNNSNYGLSMSKPNDAKAYNDLKKKHKYKCIIENSIYLYR